MKSKIYQRIKEIDKELLELDSEKLFSSLERLNFTQELFARNYAELISLLDNLKSSDFDKMTLFSRTKMHIAEGIYKEVSFLLHNYVSSGKTLLDHSRIVYQQGSLARILGHQYDSCLRMHITNNSVVKFMEKLRNMNQHYRMIAIGVTYELYSQKVRFNIDAEALLKFDGWNSESREFIEANRPKIDLYDTLTSYHASIVNFHDSVKNLLYDAKQSAIKVINEKIAESNALRARLAQAQIVQFLDNDEHITLHNIRFYIAPLLSSHIFTILDKEHKFDKD